MNKEGTFDQGFKYWRKMKRKLASKFYSRQLSKLADKVNWQSQRIESMSNLPVSV